MSTFIEFRDAVNRRIQDMTLNAGQVFKVKVDKDVVWNTYLQSFPEGADPLFRERTEHDCNCCKNFIRDVGTMLTIDDKGNALSVWDVDVGGTYQVVADALSALVKSSEIEAPFRHREAKIGAEYNFEVANGAKWDHFYAELPRSIVLKESGTFLGNAKSNCSVLKRSLEEITIEAIEIVDDLIAQNAIYRGEEHKGIVSTLIKLKREYTKIDDPLKKDRFLWSKSTAMGMAAKIRNTVIGTLLTDISEGVELTKAVKSFEDKVAPHNYKRTTALITKGMIEKAQKKVQEMGLEDALYRRYAVEEDISITNVLFADRDAQKRMKDSVFDDLAPTAGYKAPKLDKLQEVEINDFVENVLPKATSLEVFLENSHEANLMSVIAPVYPEAGNILKWDNNFSWSYSGEVADSDLKKSVAQQGGRVDGVFRFSHTWNYRERNASLMDLHVFMPKSTKRFENGVNDSYGNNSRVGWNNRKHGASGGVQDVDYVNPAPAGYQPVENITFPDIKKMPEGKYVCMIHNWQARSPNKGGFKAEIEFGGQIFEYEVTRPLKNKEWVMVATVTLKDGQFSIEHHLPTETASREVWGVPTQQFRKVKMVMNSPNHWDGQETGNKHWFFILDGCNCPGPARGFYNEFLRNELTEHRKVFETLSSKMKTEESQNQLSGVGFSSTQRNHLIVKVTGSFNRTIKLKF